MCTAVDICDGTHISLNSAGILDDSVNAACLSGKNWRAYRHFLLLSWESIVRWQELRKRNLESFLRDVCFHTQWVLRTQS